MGKENKTETQVDLSPEARSVMSDELLLFLQNFLPGLEQVQGDILSAIGPTGESAAGEGLQRALSIADPAVESAGRQRGIPAGDIASVITRLGEEQPDFLNLMRNLFGQATESSDALIDPRFAQFLRPDVSQSVSPGAAQQVAQGAGLALGAGTLLANII